jgi:hypothetical protein
MAQDPHHNKDNKEKPDVTKMYIGDEAIETWSLLSETPAPKKPSEPPAPAPAETPDKRAVVPPKAAKIPCPHCQEANEKDREFCWACFMPMAGTLEHQDRGVVIRKSYLFVPDSDTAASAPPVAARQESKIDIDYDHQSEDTDRIRTRTGEEVIKFKKRDIQIFKGSHLIAVRIDGRNYTSDDVNIPMEAKMIIRRVQSGEPLTKILEEFKGSSKKPGISRATATSIDDAPEEKGFFKKFSTIIIIGLALVFLFVLLNMLRNF